MTWEDLPEGLVDSFRKEAFSLNGQGVIIVRLNSGTFEVVSYRDNFFAKLFDRLSALIGTHTKADIVILTGRYNDFGEPETRPEVQVRLFGV